MKNKIKLLFMRLKTFLSKGLRWVKTHLKIFFVFVFSRVKSFAVRQAKSFKRFVGNYRGWILFGVTIGSLVLSVFVYRISFGRLVESFRDFFTSFLYYICFLINVDSPLESTVNNYPEYIFQGVVVSLPESFGDFSEVTSNYWSTFFSLENFKSYLSNVSDFLYNFSQLLLLIVPLLFALYFALDKYMNTHNTDYNKNSKGLLRWFKFRDTKIKTVKTWILSVKDYILGHSFWYKSLLVVWLFNFNLITIGVEFFAWYMYFVAAFDFLNLYRQIYKLVLDLWVMLSTVPVIVWVIVGVVILEKIAARVGYSRLQHFERRNRGFINDRSLVVFVCGTMGSGKTTAITDMALSASVQMHDDAFKILLDVDFEFYHFPYQNFGLWLKRLFFNHKIFNTYTCRKYVRKLHKYYLLSRKKPQYNELLFRMLKFSSCYDFSNFCFEYDIEKYGDTYHNGILTIDLWNALEDYAQAYFIYIIQSSLILSNYSIRTDEECEDLGNFPLWNSSFFERNRRRIRKSHHAHILDQDMLRLGTKMIKDNPNFYAFGFGVYVISEIDKERQNALQLQETKIKTAECNQKNDMFNDMIKMVRHGTVVRNIPFIHFFVDAQRPEDWGASAREVAEVVHIREKCEARVVLPFFSPFRVFDLIYSFLFPKIVNCYTQYSHVRGDNTFLMYVIKSIGAAMQHYYERIYNIYGCSSLNLALESGKLDGEFKEAKYYLNFQKIYKDRFNTAALSGFFEKMSRKATIGINDMPEYGGTTATDEELKMQNSHFFKRISVYSELLYKKDKGV